MNRDAIAAEIRRRDLDAAVAVSMENVYYSSSALLLTQRLIPERLVTDDGARILSPYAS